MAKLLLSLNETFGLLLSRWIRLLFGREYPLPGLLYLWDAMFADGRTLDLADFIFIAMLIHIRNFCEYTVNILNLNSYSNYSIVYCQSQATLFQNFIQLSCRVIACLFRLEKKYVQASILSPFNVLLSSQFAVLLP